MADLLYIEKIESSDRAAFTTKIVDIAAKLKVNPNWLMVVMNSESGINPKAYNPNGGATGLIQFMPATAKSLGTTTDQLKKMKASEQLDYVYKYFKPYAGKFKGAYDIYLVTFFPLAVGKPDNWVFETKNLSRSTIAKGNPAIDLNKNNEITVKEFKEWFEKRIGAEILKQIASTQNIQLFFLQRMWSKPTGKIIIIGTSVLVLGVGSYLILTNLKKK